MSYREKSKFHFLQKVVLFYFILYNTIQYNTILYYTIASHILNNNEKSLHSLYVNIYLWNYCVCLGEFEKVFFILNKTKRLKNSQTWQNNFTRKTTW